MRLVDLDRLDQARLAEVARLVRDTGRLDDLHDARILVGVLMRRMRRDDREAGRIVGRLVEAAADRRDLPALALRLIESGSRVDA